MDRFLLRDTPISSLAVIDRRPIGDSRGYLERLYCSTALEDVLGKRKIEQINHTFTSQAGTVRGLHFQHFPCAEYKLVSCLHGKIFDVAVDLRRGSPTFLQWHGEILSGENFRMMCIPEGFAHGFQTLTNDCELIYFHTAAYSAEYEDGLNALDPILNITWPVDVSERSIRDQGFKLVSSTFSGLPL